MKHMLPYLVLFQFLKQFFYLFFSKNEFASNLFIYQEAKWL